MYSHIQDYLQSDIYPFHMPGHKRNPMFIPQNLGEMDLTEIPGMDVLGAPTGIIKALQDDIAGFYGANESYLLVNGSSAGIIAAICTVCNPGSSIYAARNSHVSVYSGVALAGALPRYIFPEITGDGLAGGVKPEAFDGITEGAVVIVVSPTYEGFVSDIKEIAARVHSRGGILIVDEAHGAHFKYSDAFPISALELGADIVVQSFHKTLPALGQTAVLHVKSPRVDISRLRVFLNAMQTTSPSYMLMGQLDYVLKMLWKRPEIFETYVSRLTKLRIALSTSEVQPINLVGRERVGEYGIYDMDMSKLLFNLNIDTGSEDISEMLAGRYKVQMEMSNQRHMLAMTSVADTDEGLQRLWGAIGSLNIRLDVAVYAASPPSYEYPPEQVLPPSEAIRRETEIIPWKKARGRIAGEVLAAYPPGIALVAPGERIPKGLPQVARNVRVLV